MRYALLTFLLGLTIAALANAADSQAEACTPVNLTMNVGDSVTVPVDVKVLQVLEKDGDPYRIQLGKKVWTGLWKWFTYTSVGLDTSTVPSGIEITSVSPQSHVPADYAYTTYTTDLYGNEGMFTSYCKPNPTFTFTQVTFKATAAGTYDFNLHPLVGGIDPSNDTIDGRLPGDLSSCWTPVHIVVAAPVAPTVSVSPSRSKIYSDSTANINASFTADPNDPVTRREILKNAGGALVSSTENSTAALSGTFSPDSVGNKTFTANIDTSAQSASATCHVMVVDRPTVRISAPASQEGLAPFDVIATYTAATNDTLTATDIRWSSDNVNWNDLTNNDSVLAIKDKSFDPSLHGGAGVYYFKARARTEASNGNSDYTLATTQVSVTVAGGQTVTISPAESTIPKGTAITFTASGGQSGSYTWGGTAGATGTGAAPTKQVTFSSTGSYTVTVFSPAGDGYTVSNTASATITVTDAPPDDTATPVIVTPPSQSVSITADATHGVAPFSTTIHWESHNLDPYSDVRVYDEQGNEIGFGGWGSTEVKDLAAGAHIFTAVDYSSSPSSPIVTLDSVAVIVDAAADSVTVSARAVPLGDQGIWVTPSDFASLTVPIRSANADIAIGPRIFVFPSSGYRGMDAVVVAWVPKGMSYEYWSNAGGGYNPSTQSVDSGTTPLLAPQKAFLFADYSGSNEGRMWYHRMAPGTYTFTLKAGNPARDYTATCTVHRYPNDPPPPAVSISADSITLTAGQSATLSWTLSQGAGLKDQCLTYTKPSGRGMDYLPVSSVWSNQDQRYHVATSCSTGVLRVPGTYVYTATATNSIDPDASASVTITVK